MQLPNGPGSVAAAESAVAFGEDERTKCNHAWNLLQQTPPLSLSGGRMEKDVKKTIKTQ